LGIAFLIGAMIDHMHVLRRDCQMLCDVARAGMADGEDGSSAACGPTDEGCIETMVDTAAVGRQQGRNEIVDRDHDGTGLPRRRGPIGYPQKIGLQLFCGAGDTYLLPPELTQRARQSR
jgi:hypothetical protein